MKAYIIVFIVLCILVFIGMIICLSVERAREAKKFRNMAVLAGGGAAAAAAATTASETGIDGRRTCC